VYQSYGKTMHQCRRVQSNCQRIIWPGLGLLESPVRYTYCTYGSRLAPGSHRVDHGSGSAVLSDFAAWHIPQCNCVMRPSRDIINYNTRDARRGEYRKQITRSQTTCELLYRGCSKTRKSMAPSRQSSLNSGPQSPAPDIFQVPPRN